MKNEFDSNETYKVVTENTKPLKFTERIASLFVSPAKLMENIADNPKVAAAFIVNIILCLLVLPFSQSATRIILEQQALVFTERYGPSFYEVYQMQQAKQLTGVLNYVTTFGISLVGVLIAIVFDAILLIILTKIFKGTAKFLQYVSMLFHISIISAIGLLVYYIGIVVLKTSLNITSLAAVLMPNGNLTVFLYNILSSITIFTIWKYFLVFLGVKITNGFNAVKSAVIAIISFLIALITAAILASVVVWGYDAIFGQMIR